MLERKNIPTYKCCIYACSPKVATRREQRGVNVSIDGDWGVVHISASASSSACSRKGREVSRENK